MNEELPPLYTLFAGALVRHVLTAVCALLASHGLANASTLQTVLGSSGVILATGWSLYQKFSHSDTAKQILLAVEQRAIRAARGGVAAIICALALGAAAIIAPACASHTPIQTATIAETAAVQAVHAVVTSEASAYKAGAYDRAAHEKYLHALQKVIIGERALNDALLVWAKTQGQPMPVAVTEAVRSLAGILKDLQPLIPTNRTVGDLSAALADAISQLTGG